MNTNNMTAEEWLFRLADALQKTREAPVDTCSTPGCSTPIRRGVRCEECRKKRHADIERARLERIRVVAKSSPSAQATS